MHQKTFISAFLWNTLNVFLYKIMLQTHQVCLFYVINKELFGISGTIFSAIYLLISLTNFGFDYSLFAFHKNYIQNKIQFQSLIHQFIIRIITLISTIIFLICTIPYLSHFSPVSFIATHTPSGLIMILIMIFTAESLRKTLELFAHLSFLNKTITIVDIATLASYISILWCSFFIRGYIDLYAIFITMCLTSWIELIIITMRIYYFYQTIPEQTHDYQMIKTKDIFQNQMINYVNQITKAVFSPNFIIIFLAYHLGMTKAGYIKLIIDIVILLYILLNRSVGIPTGALMSQASGMQVSLMPNFKNTFLKITNGYIQFLYVLACIMIFTWTPCFFQSSNSVLTINILFFTFSGFLEYMIITYEKLYLTQKATNTLAVINLCSLVLLLSTLYFSNSLTDSYILIPFVIIRLCAIVAIVIRAYQIWHVLPSLRIHKLTAIICLIIFALSLLWYCL